MGRGAYDVTVYVEGGLSTCQDEVDHISDEYRRDTEQEHEVKVIQDEDEDEDEDEETCQ